MKFFVLFILLNSLFSCVSVSLPQASGEKASGITYTAPSKPFHEISSSTADKAWISEVLGNTISYISECKNPLDPTLQQIENESLVVLSDLKIISSQKTNFNGREALKSVASGYVDGIPVQISVLSFKKNKCSYSLTYGGVQKNFSVEISHFEDFLKGFNAP